MWQIVNIWGSIKKLKRNLQAMMSIPILPSSLISSVAGQKAVLFLGAGASMGARSTDGRRPPGGNDLKQSLNAKYFPGDDLAGYDLMQVAEYAITTHGAPEVFDFVRTQLAGFQPSSGHHLLAQFRWRALATTNYDTLIEQAYSENTKRLQSLVPFVKSSEPIESRLQGVLNPVVLMKVHGCLNHISDNEIPLILSHEQYATHEHGRKNLFSRLTSLVHESPFIFCGYALSDPHIRKLLYKIAADDVQRPIFYIVSPSISKIDEDFWRKHRVEPIKATFDEFMAALDKQITVPERTIPVAQSVQIEPIRKHFRTTQLESPLLADALDNDFSYPHESMSHEPLDPRNFYSGYDPGWTAIAQDLDAKRSVIESIIYETMFTAETDRALKFFVLKGPAGNGKTIALKRLIWTSINVLNQMALWLNDTGNLNSEPLIELYSLTGKRLHLFIDRVSNHCGKVAELIKEFKARDIPLTIICSETNSEWNSHCGDLESFKPKDFPIRYLSETEIHSLIDLLAKHNSLGLLDGKTREQQIAAFTEVAGRQLLVALHEATKGKNFEEIILEEFNSISDDYARQLYLDICTLNQFGVPVRAGTVSRISDIQFEDYQKDFLKPLEFIVMPSKDRYSGDFVYKARHAKVASLVFRLVCDSDDKKVRQIERILAGMDLGYESDRIAIDGLFKGRAFAQAFSDINSGRKLFRAALEQFEQPAFLNHQWAVFELNHTAGSLTEAEQQAAKARSKSNASNPIKHTQAEIARQRANQEKSPLLKQQLRRQCQAFLGEMSNSKNKFATLTRCKMFVDSITELTDETDFTNPDSEAIYIEAVKDAERLFESAYQRFSDHPEIYATEARFRDILEQNSKAITALENAWKKKPKGHGVSIRLAKAYLKRSEPHKALTVLSEGLDRFPDEKQLHYEMAKLLIQTTPMDTKKAELHLGRSYSFNDANYDSRHLHAQLLFKLNDLPKAMELFAAVDEEAPKDFRRYPTEHTLVSKTLPTYTGIISKNLQGFFFVESPIYSKEIYGNAHKLSSELVESLKPGKKVAFNVTFDRAGPVIHEISLLDAELEPAEKSKAPDLFIEAEELL